MLKIEANMYVLKIVQIYVDSVQLANTGSNQMIAIYCVNFPNHQYKNLSLIPGGNMSVMVKAGILENRKCKFIFGVCIDSTP